MSPAPIERAADGRRAGTHRPSSDSVMLLLGGLFQTVKDIGVVELRNNTMMLAKLADENPRHRPPRQSPRVRTG